MSSADRNTAAKKCLEVWNQMCAVLVDALSSRATRTIDNAKSVYEIVTRPYARPWTIDGVATENFDRAQEIVSLTVTEMLTTSRRVTEVTESLLETSAVLQEAWLHYLSGMMAPGLMAPGLTSIGPAETPKPVALAAAKSSKGSAKRLAAAPKPLAIAAVSGTN